ncbi:MAG TPA: SRPBCC family protein [Candidatus Limnocylindria bacterium]|nr:SRPBCC family protein [Candidatus Limnocylindria bacterium]
MRTIHGVALGLVLAAAIGGCGGCGGGETAGPVPEIATERIEKRGDTWHVSFVTHFDAPVDKVYEAFTHPEKGQEILPQSILKSEVVSEDGNVKVVDIVGRLEILPPGFKVQTLRNEYTFYPGEKRITSRSIDFKLADINSELKFTPSNDGKGTTLTFSQTSKDKAPMLVESLQKGALRETYVTQVKIADKALGIQRPDTAKQG